MKTISGMKAVKRPNAIIPKPIFTVKVASTDCFSSNIEKHNTPKEVVTHVTELLDAVGINLDKDFAVSTKCGRTYKLALTLVEVA